MSEGADDVQVTPKHPMSPTNGLRRGWTEEAPAIRRRLKRLYARIHISVLESLYRLPTARAKALDSLNEQRLGATNRWLVESERELVDGLGRLIVPSDDERPGWEEIDVLDEPPVDRIDGFVANSPVKKTLYVRGLASIDRISLRRFGLPFIDLPASKQADVFRRLVELDRAGRIRLGLVGSGIKVAKRMARVLQGSWEAVELLPILLRDVYAVFLFEQGKLGLAGFRRPTHAPGVSRSYKSQRARCRAWGSRFSGNGTSPEPPP